MTDTERRKAAKAFSEYWKDRGDEKSDSQSFWLALCRDVLGVAEPEKFILFEERVKLDHTSFIDGHIPSTHILIEQKKRGLNLRAPIRQSDGTLLSPFGQAQRYSAALPYSQRPRWIITCNFEEFLIYDMEKPTGEPESILLKDLQKEYYRLQFLVEEKSEFLHREEQISIQAGELVGKLYDAILKQYIHPDDKASLHSLNILCVRLVFCLYAEDAGIFGGHNKFHNYIKSFAPKDVRRALIDLFEVLNTPDEKQPVNMRDPYMDEQLAAFPYVNGGLFATANIEIPNFTQEIVDLLLHNASEDFDWSQISPTIFGAVFESTLNPETRRSGGMHYTSIENIHKVIDPLFLDELRGEFDEIKNIKVPKIRRDRAETYREKLSGLTFFDPACGSGNFLTETYISLRRLENEALKLIYEEQIAYDFGDVIKVSIGQFYGIEINDFAVTVAKTALWIAESQMMRETEEILNTSLDFLPLKSYANITEGNALRVDWESVVPKDKLNYIMGNPPFSAGRRMGDSQRKDMEYIAAEFENSGELDYVSLWYIVSAQYMQNTSIKAGFVSTSSITQGEQVNLLWKPLVEKYNLNKIFAVRSFNWQSESKKSAGVHCVIIGFCIGKTNIEKYIYDNGLTNKVSYINGYLLDAPNTWISAQKTPICDVPNISNGSKPLDNAICAFTPEEKADFILREPSSEPYFYRYMGSREFINNIERWFLFINRIPLHQIRKMPEVLKKLQEIRDYRLASSSLQTKKLAEFPSKFHFENIPTDNYLVIPQTSSGKRKYVPIGFLTSDTLVNNKLQIMKNGSIYEFGILSSNVHNSWLRTIGGRLRDDFTYSVSVVYNTFPWPTPTAEQKAKIEQTAQAILDARALYPDCSLADLYDELTMPPELRKAHQANDRAVMQAYGFDVKTMTESGCVAELMKMYQELTK